MTKIKELRLAKGLKQGALAKILNVTQANLSAWELGKWQPDSDMLIKIAQFFGVSVDYLLGVTSSTVFTTSDYISGIIDTQKESITAIEMIMLETFRQIGAEYGEQGQERAIEILKLAFRKGE